MDPLEPNVTFSRLQRSPSSTQAEFRQRGGAAGGEEVFTLKIIMVLRKNRLVRTHVLMDDHFFLSLFSSF